MRIALFGGSFDPVHNGHIEMAQAFVQALSLDRVIFMPTGDPPHKLRADMASPEHRLEMCRLSTEPFSWAQVSDLELRREGASFTVDTLLQLKNEYPDAQWYLLTGADMFVTLHSWYRFADIARLATLCTLPRDERDASQLMESAARLEQDGARCVVLPQGVQQVSSSQLRQRIRTGGDLSPYMPASVAAYICQHGLYLDKAGMSHKSEEAQYIDLLRPRLTEKRFAHSLAVADRAEELAKKYGADPVKARTAGILHDIMKDTPLNAQLQIQKEFGILMDTVTVDAPKLWHAVTGAAFLEHVLELDEDIVRAVRYHTTGRAGMSLLEKVVYLADFTSADRDYPDVSVMRELSDNEPDEAMRYALAYTIAELNEKQRTVHPDTQDAYNECISLK